MDMERSLAINNSLCLLVQSVHPVLIFVTSKSNQNSMLELKYTLEKKKKKQVFCALGVCLKL